MGLFWNKKADEQQAISENAAATEGADGVMPSQPGKTTRLKGTLVARGLCKSYRGRQVVNGVSLAYALVKRLAFSALTVPVRPHASIW